MQVFLLLAVIILLFYADLWSNPNFGFIIFTFIFLSWEKDDLAQELSTTMSLRNIETI